MHAGGAEADPGQAGGEHHRAARLEVVGVLRPRGAGSARRTRAPSPTTRRRPGWRPGRAAGRRASRAARARRRAWRRTTRPRGRRRRARTRRSPRRARRAGARGRRCPGAGAGSGARSRSWSCGREVEHGDGGRLRAGARRGRDRQQRLERPRRLLAPADRRVDVVHDRRRVGRDQVGDLGGVEARAAADPDEAVEVAVDREVGRLLQRLRGRLDARAVEDDGLDAGRLDRLDTRPVIPASTTPGSLTTITLEAPRRSSSQPASAEAPGPNLIGVASRVKTVSFVTRLPRAPRSAAGLRTKRSVGGRDVSVVADVVRYVSRANSVATTVIARHAHHVERDRLRLVAARREQRDRDQRGEAAGEHRRELVADRRAGVAHARRRTARRSTRPAARTSGRGRR